MIKTDVTRIVFSQYRKLLSMIQNIDINVDQCDLQ